MLYTPYSVCCRMLASAGCRLDFEEGELLPAGVVHPLTLSQWLSNNSTAWPTAVRPTRLAVGQALLECAVAQNRQCQLTFMDAALVLGNVELLCAALAAFRHLHPHQAWRRVGMNGRLEAALRDLAPPPRVRESYERRPERTIRSIHMNALPQAANCQQPVACVLCLCLGSAALGAGL